jgi:hypothetical protein
VTFADRRHLVTAALFWFEIDVSYAIQIRSADSAASSPAPPPQTEQKIRGGFAITHRFFASEKLASLATCGNAN